MLGDHLLQKNVVVVAHPDDETFFAGGLILRYPGDWTVICCSVPPRDPIRAYKFFLACERLQVKARLLPFIEPDVMRPPREMLDLSDFDCVVTHGKNGEYGHHHHKELHQWIYDQWDKPLISFSGSETFEMSEREVDNRLYALQAYDHKSPSDTKPKWMALIDRYGLLAKQEYEICR